MSYELAALDREMSSPEDDTLPLGKIVVANTLAQLEQNWHLLQSLSVREELLQSFTTLEEATVNIRDVGAEYKQLCIVLAYDVVKEKLLRHKAMLKSGKVMLHDPNKAEPIWAPIKFSEKEAFDGYFDSIQIDVTGFGADLSQSHETKELCENPHPLASIAGEEIFAALNELTKAAASMATHEMTPEDQLAPKQTLLLETIVQKTAPNPTLERKARKIIQAIEKFADGGATRTLAEAIMAQVKVEHTAVIHTQLHELICTTNAETIASIKRDTAKKIHPATDSSLAKKRKNNRLGAPVDQEHLPIPKVSEMNHEGKLRTVGTHQFTFPWLREKQTPLYQFTQSGGTVCALDGSTPHLNRLYKRNIQQNPSLNDRMFKIIQLQLRRLAAGIMPYESGSGVRAVEGIPKLHRDNYEHPFAGQSVWYAAELGDVGPRLYFTLKSMGEILAPGADSPSITPDTLCMVILSQGDKSVQIATLKALTDQSHRHIRQHGAGQI